MKRYQPIFDMTITILIIVTTIFSNIRITELEKTITAATAIVETSADPDAGVELVDDPEDADEALKIQEALLAKGYFRDDVPLSYDLQDVLHAVCDQNGIEYEVALGLIQTESDFNSNSSSSVGCYGLCQLNPKYFPSNLDDADNITYGINYLGSQLKRYSGDLEAALTAYNAGRDTGSRSYARLVLSRAEQWKVSATNSNY